MNLPRVQREMHEDSLWTLCPVQDIDALLTTRYGPDSTFSLLYCDLYMRQFKETFKKTMLDQESAFEDQIHELHRLYQRQKDLMMEVEGTNNLFLNAGVSSSRASTHWMGSSISTSKTSVFPPEDASAKINKAGISGKKALNLELLSYGYRDIWGEEEGSKNRGGVVNYPKEQSSKRMSFKSVVQPENVLHLTGSAGFKCLLDLNEPAKIEEHSDYELNPLLSQAQTRSERAEPEAQELPITTISQAVNGIDLNMSPFSSEEEVTVVKTIESEKPRHFVLASLHGKHRPGPSRKLVQALPSSKTISLFQKRWSLSRKNAKRGAKSTNVKTVPRRRARKDSNVDLNVGVNEDDKHSLGTTSDIPESYYNQELLEKGSLSSLPEVISARNWSKTGKRRRCRPQIESGKVMKNIAKTKTKTRGSFLVTEEEEQEKSAAAEAIVDMSLSDSARESSKETSDCITPLCWFAKIASSVVEDPKSEVGLSVTGFHSNYQIDYYEAMTLQLSTEMKQEEQRTNISVSHIVTPKHKRSRRSQLDNKFLPSLSTFTGNEGSRDPQTIERLMETNDDHSSYCNLTENMRVDWGSIRKRRRGSRNAAANTKTCIASFLQVPFSGS